MNKDKKKVLLLSLTIFAVLLAALFVNVLNSKILTACVLAPLAALTFFGIKRRSSTSIHKRDVLILMAVIAVIYVVVKEMTGIYFEFYKNPYYVNSKNFLGSVLPIFVTILSVEVIRSVMLAQKMRSASLITYLSCVLAEVLIFTNVAGIYSFNRFMDLVGLTLFPALSANCLYHYLSKRYGMLPNVVFRVITTLYVYFIPARTGMEEALDSCIKIVLPIAIYVFVSAMFEKKQKKAIQKGKKVSAVLTVITVVIMAAIAMLISCQFRFGALVIATESMTGEINKGDMIIYERYDGQRISEGQVIVFLQNDNKIVHRVVEIKTIQGETRYYTKGDANEEIDVGYRVEEDLFGVTDLKVAYLGYPTLWIRDLLSGKN